MYKIIFSENFWNTLGKYSDSYLNYFEELYSDSWIWSEDIIIDYYGKESRIRYTEIVDIVEEKLSNPLISYHNQTAIIRWRSKILLVSFIDDENTRIITDLEIR